MTSVTSLHSSRYNLLVNYAQLFNIQPVWYSTAVLLSHTILVEPVPVPQRTTKCRHKLYTEINEKNKTTAQRTVTHTTMLCKKISLILL